MMTTARLLPLLPLRISIAFMSSVISRLLLALCVAVRPLWHRLASELHIIRVHMQLWIPIERELRHGRDALQQKVAAAEQEHVEQDIVSEVFIAVEIEIRRVEARVEA